MMDHLNKIIETAKELKWNVYQVPYYIRFSRYSPAGQDFNIEIDYTDVEDILKKVSDFYEAYDVSYETYLWLDELGHGTNGAPYDMRDLYDDMEACENMVCELAEALESIDFN